jgi:hypothetical protein
VDASRVTLGVEDRVVVGSRLFQYATASSHSSPLGACARPFR